MSLSREEAHKLVDQLFDNANGAEAEQASITPAEAAGEPEVPARVLPEGKKVVRTKSSGDRVYLLDEVKKTRQWITNPDVLDSLGFELNDVNEVDENEMLKFQMGPALYRRVDEQS